MGRGFGGILAVRRRLLRARETVTLKGYFEKKNSGVHSECVKETFVFVEGRLLQLHLR